MKKRNTLLAQGWALAPIYVGQQESGPGSHIVISGSRPSRRPPP
ncbi:MAG TPA: hypothetical protein VLC09_01580 [Polyangiaceae bacterium]|nr:hypothetical protein [Polyangiaceae bacterium]